MAGETGQVPDSERYLGQHRTTGFGFYPHNLLPVDGDLTYGDTSMSLDYLRNGFPDWRVVGFDDRYVDPCQQIVYLVPA
ncbi:MAG: hypothetical protein KDE27_29770 [Planctomycetes bacterium]|nr:hypothetical protein [Planctomycetota bacterium]